MAGILKSQGTRTSHAAARAAAFNFEDMTAKAEEYLQHVRQQAEQIVARANAEAEQVRQGARRDGHRDAVAQAERSMQNKVQKQLKFLVPAIQEAVVEVDRERAAWLRRWEANAVAIAIAIAERVIRREIASSPEITVDLLRESLQLASGVGTLKVRLNPRDYEALKGQLTMVVDEMQKLASTEIVCDESVSPGGCCVDTQYGTVDQQIETQLQRIREELTSGQ